jgi:hypothetical protein
MPEAAFKNSQLTSELVRAARALLRWDQRRLAESSSVSLATIKRLEAKPGTLIAHAVTVIAIRHALEAAGVEFTNGEQPGVRLRKGHKKG